MTYDKILFNKFSEPAIIFCYAQGEIVTVDFNDQYLPELGMNIDEKEYKNSDPLEVFDDNNLKLYRDAITKCIENQEEVRVETWRKLVSNCCGTDNICVRSRVVFLEQKGDSYYIYESIRNITAERTQIDVLTESERRLKIAAEQINIYYWEYTVATKEMRPCFRCMRDLGLPAVVKNYPEPAIEMGIFPQDYADMYRQMHRNIEAGVKEQEADIPLTVGRVPFRVKYTTEFDAEGKPYKAYGSATLISDAEKNRVMLDETIIETLAGEYNGIYLVDLSKDEIKALKQDEISLEVFPEEYVSEEPKRFSMCMKMTSPSFEEQYGAPIDNFGEASYLQSHFFEKERHREINCKNQKNGTWCRMTFRVVSPDDKEIEKVLVCYTVLDDLRAQKLEDDRLISKQKAELERRQKQLLQMVESANRANRAKSDFLTRMSHEIRTPMNAVMGMNEIIYKSVEDEQIKEYAKDAYQAAESLLGTINEILDFSKIESGKTEITEDEYELTPFISNLYTLFALRAEDKNLALVFDIDRNLPGKICGDELHTRQVLINLLSNAVKFTDSGTITFRVNLVESAPSVLDDFVSIRYEVSDTGRGIAQADLPKMMEAFERVDEKSNHNADGAGLGVNIVRRLLGLMGADLKVESQYGKGSTFSFVLTVRVEDDSKVGDYRKSLAVTSKRDKKPMYENSKQSILVVDDNRVNLKVVRALLHKTKMKIDLADSGAEGLAKCLKSKYDVIFLDHLMPEMDGVETLHQLKEQKNGLNRNTPVVVLTANAIKGVEEKYRELGFDDVVFKPTTQAELNEILWKHCNK